MQQFAAPGEISFATGGGARDSAHFKTKPLVVRLLRAATSRPLPSARPNVVARATIEMDAPSRRRPQTNCRRRGRRELLSLFLLLLLLLLHFFSSAHCLRNCFSAATCAPEAAAAARALPNQRNQPRPQSAQPNQRRQHLRQSRSSGAVAASNGSAASARQPAPFD